jgi:DNA-binding transcriptional LysR family regulator
MMLDWNDLRYALAVAREGSLSGAARPLGVHQSTVGRHIDALESALGVQLFLRTVGGLVATADGATLLASIDEVGATLTRFERGARGTPGKVSGLVRIGITETGARQLVEGALPDLFSRHPELSIELVPSNQPSDLARGEVDMAVRLVVPDQELIARRIGDVTYGLYGSDLYSAKNRRPLKEGLAGHDIVVPSRELASGPEGIWLVKHANLARKRLHSSSLATLAQAVAAGSGLCVLPKNLARLYLGARLLKMLPEIPLRTVWLVLRPELRKVPRVRAVASAVMEELRKRLA